MYAVTLAHSFWYRGRDVVAVFGVAAGTLVAWPFCGALGIPIALDMVLVRRRLASFLAFGVQALLVILVPLVVVDSHFYQKIVVAPANIVLYNVLSTTTSSELYGRF